MGCWEKSCCKDGGISNGKRNCWNDSYGRYLCLYDMLKTVGFSREEIAVCVVPFAISFLGMIFTFIYFKG